MKLGAFSDALKDLSHGLNSKGAAASDKKDAEEKAAKVEKDAEAAAAGAKQSAVKAAEEEKKKADKNPDAVMAEAGTQHADAVPALKEKNAASAEVQPEHAIESKKFGNEEQKEPISPSERQRKKEVNEKERQKQEQARCQAQKAEKKTKAESSAKAKAEQTMQEALSFVEQKWQYKDLKGNVQGPFPTEKMQQWYEKKLLKNDLQLRCRLCIGRTTAFSEFSPLRNLFPEVSDAFTVPPKPKVWNIESKGNVLQRNFSEEEILKLLYLENE